MLHKITIQKNDAGQRLDKFVLKFMPSLPKNMLYRLIRQKDVKYNQKRCQGNEILKEGDVLQIYAKEEFFEKKSAPTAENFSVPVNLQIIYEDQNFLILRKPVGQDVHSGAEKKIPDLTKQIQAYLFQKGEYQPEQEQSFSPALCNRIDRNTEGLVIAGKNAEALRAMNEAIRLHQIQKQYLAITTKPLPKKKETCTAWLKKNPTGNRVQISETPKDKSWLQIITQYEVLARHGQRQLVRVTLQTGRTHQIRSHLAFLGSPLLGDAKYGDNSGTEPQQCLCAFSLSFQNVTAPALLYLKDKVIKAPVPAFVKNYFPEISGL